MVNIDDYDELDETGQEIALTIESLEKWPGDTDLMGWLILNTPMIKLTPLLLADKRFFDAITLFTGIIQKVKETHPEKLDSAVLSVLESDDLGAAFRDWFNSYFMPNEKKVMESIRDLARRDGTDVVYVDKLLAEHHRLNAIIHTTTSDELVAEFTDNRDKLIRTLVDALFIADFGKNFSKHLQLPKD